MTTPTVHKSDVEQVFSLWNERSLTGCRSPTYTREGHIAVSVCRFRRADCNRMAVIERDRGAPRWHLTQYEFFRPALNPAITHPPSMPHAWPMLLDGARRMAAKVSSFTLITGLSIPGL